MVAHGVVAFSMTLTCSSPSWALPGLCPCALNQSGEEGAQHGEDVGVLRRQGSTSSAVGRRSL